MEQQKRSKDTLKCLKKCSENVKKLKKGDFLLVLKG